MRRLMTLVANRRVDLTPLITHAFTLEQLAEAFDLFGHQAGGVLKVAIYPMGVPANRRHIKEAVDVQC